jgi:predicted metal-dependent phosphoesterase TrpH
MASRWTPDGAHVDSVRIRVRFGHEPGSERPTRYPRNVPRPSTVAAARHPHLTGELEPGWVRVDLHTHTMWSGDSTTTPDEIEQAVLDSGIDVLCITDHNAIKGAQELVDRLPCRVIVGEELRTHAGEIIGLFLTERVPFGVPPLEAAQLIRDQGGVVYVPHPFDPMRRNLSEAALDALVAEGLVDAIEVLNAKTSLSSLNRRAHDYATSHSLLAGAGSDAHVPLALGAAFVEMPDFDGPQEFLASLAQARVVGHHWDEPRPWTARVVPSTSSTSSE